jgi:hypothetical protein
MRASQGKLKTKEPPPEAAIDSLHPLLSSPLEEYCLALLLQHPELKANNEELSAEYFENSENREIFTAWQKINDIPSLKKKLDITIHEHLDSLAIKDLLVTSQQESEAAFADCVLRLRRKFLQGLAAKRTEALTLEPQSDSTEAGLAKLQEPAREISSQLGEVFTRRSQKR